MAYVRLSPGVWRDSKTGKTIQSAKDPNGAAPVVKNPKTKTPVAATGPSLATTAAGVQANTDWQRSDAAGPSLEGFDKYRTINEQTYAPERKRIEDATYGNLTQGWEQKQAAEKQQFDQDLYNRGYRPDQAGAGQYQDLSGQFQKSWMDRYDQARNTAVQTGGNEYDAALAAQENQITNRFNEALGARQQYSGTTQGLLQQNTQAQQQIANAKYQRGQLAAQAAALRAQSRPSGRPSGSGTNNDPGFDVV